VADEDDVRANMMSTGYPMQSVSLIRGDVSKTLPNHIPRKIALLRLDTDFYESTRDELLHLYPRLVIGGILIIDDYGYWQGARKAVDEFLATLKPRPYMSRIDSTGRLIVKP
jgi:hypothetical protein